MNKKFALEKINYILIAIGVILIILGFALMAGPGSSTEAFEPDIFSVRRIKVAPVVCFVGFVSMIFAILYRPKQKDMKNEE
jgi:uncharacterized membrane protein